MPADLWGDLPLHVMDYSRPAAHVFMTEKPLIPDPSQTGPQSVLMGGGRGRMRRDVNGWAYRPEFDALESDFYAQVQRTVRFFDGFSMNALIEKLEKADVKVGADNHVFFTVAFVEV